MNPPNNITTHTNKLPGSSRRQTYNCQLVRCESTPHTSEPLRTKHYGITKTGTNTPLKNIKTAHNAGLRTRFVCVQLCYWVHISTSETFSVISFSYEDGKSWEKLCRDIQSIVSLHLGLSFIHFPTTVVEVLINF